MRPDHLAIGEHVIVLVLPLAGRAEGVGAFEGEITWWSLVVIWFTSDRLNSATNLMPKNDFGPNKGATHAYKPH
jgi:hypothetical protein